RYVSFSTGKEYIYTRRDDGKTTRMPQIPSFEPEINGICHGQLIHATTNPNTLGKAYSHGCMGTREEDAWRIYFYVRPGTPIEIRYDLHGVDEAGNPVEFEDVYQLKNKTL
ncbi:MAG: L,D-transpeptidase, partial [Bacteroidetes bacterium]|nr:L,D-transpeptidase [Bacteroidota bacterium]